MGGSTRMAGHQNGVAASPHQTQTRAQRLRERIIQANDLPEKAFHIVEWDEKDAEGNVIEPTWIVMKALTAAERLMITQSTQVAREAMQPAQNGQRQVPQQAPTQDVLRVSALVMIYSMHEALPDPEDAENPAKMRAGERIFSIADQKAVLDKNLKSIDDAVAWVMEASGMGQKAVDEAKNASKPTENSDSPTGSLETWDIPGLS